MCGIVGLIAKNDNGFNSLEETLFKEMLIADQLRGEDSTGVFGVSLNSKPDVVKGAMHSSDFVTTKAYNSFATALYNRYKIVVGHNRKATKGNVVAANAHPFMEGKITLVHNGTIRNQSKLNADVEVDSHAICHALNDNDAVKALGLIDGAFALVWYDSEAKTLNLARNDERPLYLSEFDNFWCFASEPAMVFWLAGRHGLKAKDYKEVPTEKILTFNLNSRREYKEVDFKEWTYAPPPVVVAPPTYKTNVTYMNPEPRKKEIPRLLENKTGLGQNSSAAVGSTLLIKWVDFIDRKDDGIPGVRIIGHPVYRDTGLSVDENIFVSFWKPDLSEKEFDDLFDKRYYSGVVHSFNNVNGSPTFYVRDVNPVEIGVTSNGIALTELEFNDAIKVGCKHCDTKTMNFKNIRRMFLKQRKDSSYRVICDTCFNPKGTETVQ